MALLRTARLFALYNPDTVGSSLLYTCPPGNRAVLRSMDLCAIVAAVEKRVIVNLFTGGENVFLFHPAHILPETESSPWRGQLVLNAGDQLFTQSSGVAFWITGSGAVMPVENP